MKIIQKFEGGGRPTSDRSSNVELLRIITMIAIVAHHYVLSSGIFDLTYGNPLAVNSLFFRIFGAWGKTGINTFVVITGFYMCQRKTNMRKLLDMVIQIITINIVAYMLFCLAGKEKMTVTNTLQAIIPIKSIDKNFVDCYLVFYLFIPYINKFIKSLDKKSYRCLLWLLLLVYSGIGFFPNAVTMNYLSWFFIVYLVGAYIRIYNEDVNRINWNFMFWGGYTISVVSIIICAWINERTGKNMGYYFVSDCNKILALVNGVSAFVFFSKLRIPQSKIINSFARSTFGVLLIHTTSDTMRTFIWRDVLKSDSHYQTPYYWIFAIVSVLIVFFSCAIIETGRRYATQGVQQIIKRKQE